MSPKKIRKSKTTTTTTTNQPGENNMENNIDMDLDGIKAV